MKNTAYAITAVERDTGLSKDVLRMWERRYGFPNPDRDDNGERAYPIEQVERLRLIKRLMDQGHRPGRLISMDPEALHALSPRRSAADPESSHAPVQVLIDLIKSHATEAYLQTMQQRLARQGLLHFVQDTLSPLTTEVGDAWMRGELEVFDEHLYTELTRRILRQAIVSLPTSTQRPRILLTTPPEELHELGLLMVEALFTLEGAQCVSLGTQTPASDIVAAAIAHQVDVVALSISPAFPARQIAPLLARLRDSLPENIALWAGGKAMERQREAPGLVIMPSLALALAALNDWRTQHA